MGWLESIGGSVTASFVVAVKRNFALLQLKFALLQMKFALLL